MTFLVFLLGYAVADRRESARSFRGGSHDELDEVGALRGTCGMFGGRARSERGDPLWTADGAWAGRDVPARLGVPVWPMLSTGDDRSRVPEPARDRGERVYLAGGLSRRRHSLVPHVCGRSCTSWWLLRSALHDPRRCLRRRPRHLRGNAARPSVHARLYPRNLVPRPWLHLPKRAWPASRYLRAGVRKPCGRSWRSSRACHPDGAFLFRGRFDR